MDKVSKSPTIINKQQGRIMYKHIIHATDLSDNHFEMCQKAAEIAKICGAKLYLLHVLEQPASLQLAQGLGFAELIEPIKTDAQTVLNVVGEALGVPSSQQFVEIGSIKTHLYEKITELACDLIIIGSHTPSAIPAILGSTAYTITQHAPCDVLTVRS